MLSAAQKIDAITWKAREAGVSYGIFSVDLSETTKKNIYDEYEIYWCKKQEKEQARLELSKTVKKKKGAKQCWKKTG